MGSLGAARRAAPVLRSVDTCARAQSFQPCPTLLDHMDCGPPGSSVHGVLQARTLEWVAMPSSRGSSQPWESTAINSAARRLWNKITLGSHLASAPSRGTEKAFAKTSVPSYHQPPQRTPSYCAHCESSLSGMALSSACVRVSWLVVPDSLRPHGL